MMKKQIILSILLMWSCWSFSQTLTPKIKLIEQETHFCFTIPQSRILAEHLAARVSNDSVIQVLKSKQAISKLLAKNQQDVLGNYQSKISSLQLLMEHKNLQIDEAKGLLEQSKKRQLVYKRKSKVLTIGMAIVTAILIIK